MDLIERLEFEADERNTKSITELEKIYPSLKKTTPLFDSSEISRYQALLADNLINYKYEKKVHAVYAVCLLFTIAGGVETSVAIMMAKVCKKIWAPEAEHTQKYNLKEIVKDQIDKEINFIDKIIGYHRQFEEIDSILKKHQYTREKLITNLSYKVVFLSTLFDIQCDILSPKMIYNILNKLYYITDTEQARIAFVYMISTNWEKLEWTHRFYLHRHFRLIERIIKNNKIPLTTDDTAKYQQTLKQRNNKWLVKNQISSDFGSKGFIPQENWTMQFKQTVRHFFNVRKTDCLVCDQLIKTDDKKQLLKHYSQKSHMQKLQDQLISLYDSKSEICAICPKSKTAEDHKGCNHDEIVKIKVCLSCFIHYRQPQYLNSHFKTKAHIYESLGVYDAQKSEALKKQLIIREARKFAIHPKHKPKHVTSIDITQSIDELEKKRHGTEKELNDFLQELLSKVEAEMNKLIKKLQKRGHRKRPDNYRLLVEYTEETIKVEDVVHSIISDVRPFYKLKKYKSEGEEKQFIESILKSELIPDGPEDGGPFSASEDEDDKSPKPFPLSSPSTSDQSVAAPEVLAETPKQKSPTDPAKDKAVSSIPLAPPPGLPHPPAPQSPTASVQLEESKLATPSKKDSPKPPSISVEPPADADDQPPPSKGAIPKKKPAELTPPKKSIISKDSSPTSPAGSGGSSPGDGGGDDPGAPDSDGSGDEDLLPNGHIDLQAKKKKSFEAITNLINQQKGNDPENIALANKLEFFLKRLYFSDFIPLDAMAACIDHFIEKLESEDS